jgi:2-polyprenyl-3-methyl-5-hydroxy-6-metoxy-1,4-benzoquinol methylase
MTVNFGNVSNDYAKYRDHLPAVLFNHLRERGIDLRDQNVIDLGSGTGIFSRDLVKQGAHVIGIEPSKELIEAIMLDRVSGINSIKYFHC